MPIELKMPALSPTMEEGTLARWLIKEGDSVSSGDLIAEIETDKATMEFEAVDEGVISKGLCIHILPRSWLELLHINILLVRRRLNSVRREEEDRFVNGKRRLSDLLFTMRCRRCAAIVQITHHDHPSPASATESMRLDARSQNPEQYCTIPYLP